MRMLRGGTEERPSGRGTRHRRSYGSLLWVVCILLPIGAASAGDSARRETPPNLVFLLVDQMRGSAMGFLGEEPVVTPNLDRLARQSVVLTSAASNYPVCSPYRAMLMTGQFPHHNGVIGNCYSRTAPYGVELKQDARCWSDVLEERGYDLAYFGKWHLEAPYKPYVDCANNRGKVAWNEWTPPARRHGFDTWYAYNTYDFHMRPLYWDQDAPRDGFHYVDQWGPEHEADLAIAYIENKQGRLRAADRPFAMVVSMNPPHTPYQQHPQKYLQPYQDRTDAELTRRPNIPPAGTPMGDMYRRQVRDYYAMITGVDEQVGRIIECLDTTGLRDRTLLVFTSDHGNCLGIHGHATKNVPEEESMRVPLMIRYPGRLAPRRDDLLISTPDLYPTMLDLMGWGDAIPGSVDGISYAAQLASGKGPRPASQPYFWIQAERPELGRRGVRTRRHTLVVTRRPDQPPQYLLYDNQADPYQLENIAARQPKVVERLISDELGPWLRKAGDPWLGKNLQLELPRRWEYSAPLVAPEKREIRPSHAQKDPTVVFYQGRWHLFMTAKLEGQSAIEYCSFKDWKQADAAKRTILAISDSDYYCAPQVFYFRPHKKWYLIYQMGVPGAKKMWVAYSTADDISDPASWTRARPILDGGPDDPREVGGLDYWIICDDKRAYLFLTSLNGKMWRLWTRLEDFPRGFGHCQLALQANIFEASHTYRIRGQHRYLTIVEENGRRYYKAYVADRLDGDWTPLADTAEKPFAGWRNVEPAAGVEPWTDNISHGELIRAGYDQTLTIDPQHWQFLFQGMWDKDKNGRKYGQFSWRLGLLTPKQ